MGSPTSPPSPPFLFLWLIYADSAGGVILYSEGPCPCASDLKRLHRVVQPHPDHFSPVGPTWVMPKTEMANSTNACSRVMLQPRCEPATPLPVRAVPKGHRPSKTPASSRALNASEGSGCFPPRVKENAEVITRGKVNKHKGHDPPPPTNPYAPAWLGGGRRVLWARGL